MLEFIGLCALLYLLFKFGGELIAGAFKVFIGLVLFILTLPFIMAFIDWFYFRVML